MHEPIASASLMILIFIAAGAVKGVTGMGLPTVAMGLLSLVMSPAAAAALLVVPSLVTNLWQGLAGPAAPRLLRRLWPMLAGIAVGTVAGSALLVRADPRWSGLALGVALIVYAAWALVSPDLSVPRRLERWLSPVVGAVTGGVTGATGVFVMPAVPWLQSLRLDKDELVQALGLSFTASTLALGAGLMLHGAFRSDQLSHSVFAVLPALAGMELGRRIRRRISATRFRQWSLILLGGLGVESVARFFA